MNIEIAIAELTRELNWFQSNLNLDDNIMAQILIECASMYERKILVKRLLDKKTPPNPIT